MKIRHTLASAILLPLLLASCNQREGDELADQGEAPDQGEALADQDTDANPCGADLQTDDLNCGACGNECEVMWAGTPYATGGCGEGECGPLWSSLFTALPPPDELTCRQVCGFSELECVTAGCSDKTAIMCLSVGDFGDQCDLGDPANEAYMELTGSCDDPVPYPEGLEPGVYPQYRCCCERG